MEGEKPASEKSVRESEKLCAGEKEFVNRRKKKVLECLKKLKINCTEDSVPRIALLGSGGGERAAVALLGSLHQMVKEELLDSVLYLGGVSGSTWSMAFLYSNPDWSMKMDEAINKLMDSSVPSTLALSAWLLLRSQEEDFSLSDVWGLFTTAVIMKQMELGKLSDELNKNPNNPYPIYCAAENNCRTKGPTEGKWFEMSPHEAGFTELGLFVETSLLGSEFQGGELVGESKSEMDMVKLQGILGSALAGKDKIREYFSDWGLGWLVDIILSNLNWDWGTTNNFLYQHKASSIPEILTSLEKINLVDAGLMINVPYPSFLGDKRDIDLIIALDCSEGDMFETLTQTGDYAAKLGKPFPDIDEKILTEKNYPEGNYVIKGEGKTPTIIHLPLFNKNNCKTQEEYDDKVKKFTTFQAPYSNDQIDELLKIAGENISEKKTKEVLLEQIREAVKRRQNK